MVIHRSLVTNYRPISLSFQTFFKTIVAEKISEDLLIIVRFIGFMHVTTLEVPDNFTSISFCGYCVIIVVFPFFTDECLEHTHTYTNGRAMKRVRT